MMSYSVRTAPVSSISIIQTAGVHGQSDRRHGPVRWCGSLSYYEVREQLATVQTRGHANAHLCYRANCNVNRLPRQIVPLL